MRIQDKQDQKGWSELYKDLIYWEGELSRANTKEMQEVFDMQKNEANTEFNKFIIKNYKSWFTAEGMKDAPLMSHNVLRNKLPKLLKENKPTFVILIDNLRFDQWRASHALPFLGGGALYRHAATESVTQRAEIKRREILVIHECREQRIDAR